MSDKEKKKPDWFSVFILGLILFCLIGMASDDVTAAYEDLQDEANTYVRTYGDITCLYIETGANSEMFCLTTEAWGLDD